MPADQQIEAVELRIVALPLVSPFVAAHGTVTTRTAVILRVIGTDGEGWGECAALPEPTYSSEWVDGAFAELRDRLVPALLAGASVSDPANPMASAAIELAVLDTECQRASTSLAHLLHPADDRRTRVPAGVAIGLRPSPDDLASEVAARVAEGYGRIKMKIALGHDLDHVRAAREAAGPDITLMVDANGAYSLDDAELLGALAAFDLHCIEQPLAHDAPGALADHAELARRIATPICLDEALTSIEITERAIELGACSVVCVKAPRLDGWRRAATLLDRCRALGVEAWVGGMLDTGLGRLANIALAAHPGATMPGDISATGRFFTDDICPPVVVDGPSGQGTVAVSAEPIGASVDADALTRLTTRVELIRR